MYIHLLGYLRVLEQSPQLFIYINILKITNIEVLSFIGALEHVDVEIGDFSTVAWVEFILT